MLGGIAFQLGMFFLVPTSLAALTAPSDDHLLRRLRNGVLHALHP